MQGNYKNESRKILVGYGAKPREYVINGVKYIVSSRFQEANPKENSKLLSDRIQRFIGSDFAHLTKFEKCAIRDSGYVCSAAERKEHI